MQKILTEFYKLTQTDPLFAAEGLDLDNARWALEELESVTNKLQILDQSIRGKFHFHLNPLSKILHPIRFLKEFIKSEHSRRHFLAKPDFSTARDLIKSYYTTLAALEKDLKSYQKVCLDAQLKTLSKNPKANTYNFYLNKVTFEEFNQSLILMIKNTFELRQEVDRRNRLLLDLFKKALKNDQRTSQDTLYIPQLKQDPIPIKRIHKTTSANFKERLNWIEQGRDYMYFLKKRFGHVSTELFGPIYYQTSLFRQKPTFHQFYVSIAKDKTNTDRSIAAILADEYHFLELEEKKYKFYADRFTYNPLIKRGIKYWYQPATAFYFTSDLTYYPDLVTTIDLKRRPQLNQALLLSQKSSLLDLIIWNGYFHNLSYLQNIKARIKAQKKIGSWHYLLVGRGYPSLYFLPFNRSVWRLDKKPSFLGIIDSKSSVHITFKQLPQNLKKQDLKNIFEGGKIRAEDVDATITHFEE